MSAPASSAKTSQDGILSDAKESTTIRFEWTLRGLKNLFDNSKGEAKSKVTKSPRFGDGRWQILFYANSGNVGTDGQTFVSLYLACEPTTDEKENAVNGKWSREGLFNFGFEIRTVQKANPFNFKEAHDHSFFYPGAQNWGWAQFARRDAVYYQSTTVRQQDAFVIVCTITSSPVNPLPVPAIPRYPVPKDLLDSMGCLLDDPIYSDVEFILPQRGKVESRRIYAAKKLLRRVDYFNAMFSSGFAESELDSRADGNDADDASDVYAFAQQFDDSDYEDEEDAVEIDNDHELPNPETQDTHSDDNQRPLQTATAVTSNKRISVSGDNPSEHHHGSGIDDDADEPDQSSRNTRQKLSHPSTPRSREVTLEHQARSCSPTPRRLEMATDRVFSEVPGPRRARVVVRDVAYATYRAVLYYLYTDTIVFAPLSSSFFASTIPPSAPHASSLVTTPAAHQSDNMGTYFVDFLGSKQQLPEAGAATGSVVVGPRSRKEWVAEWERSNSSRPRPPSAKSVYRLADRLGLQDLKERAFQHIIKSLTVDNVVHEAFSAFSAAFEDVRKIEVAYMFEHWNEVRTGAMLNIGQQLRLGRYPGFEEVWPVILQNLVTEEKKTESESTRS